MSEGAIDFYTGHPISSEIIIERLTKAEPSVARPGATLPPEALFPHDQDHYGGLEANDALAGLAGLKPGMEVVDFCAGLGGPARYLAHRYGVRVTGVELTPARVSGAGRLSRLVGLQDRVRVVEGDVTAAPLPDASADAVLSQEAFLHVPDKAAAMREAFRILRPGGRLAFTDWVAHEPMSAEDSALMRRGMAVAGLESLEGWRGLIAAAGFSLESVEDRTADWAPILKARLAMFRAMREEAAAAGTPTGDSDFHESYVRFVDLVAAGRLGGGRFAAVKPGQGG